MQYKATSPEDYILQVPKERQNTLKRLRKTIVDNLPKGFEEGIQYGMIGYYVPHSVYPDGYHCTSRNTTAIYEFCLSKKLSKSLS